MFIGQDGFIWWIGVVEDNNDPLLIGRARVRIFGYHPKAKRDETYTKTANNNVPTAYLPWAIPLMPLNLPNAYGKISIGEWVCGFFLDGENAQEPVMMGYLPAARKQSEFTYSKRETQRNFQDLEGPIADGEYFGLEFENKSNRFEWHTPSNHHIRITEVANDYGNKDFVLAHATGNLFVAMQTDKNGISRLALSHPSGTSIILAEDDIYVNSPKWGNFPLVNQINWVAYNQHTTQGGSKRGPRNFTIGTRANPPAPPPPRRGGGGCFIESSLIAMADGSKKMICEVQIGDYVLARDGKTINKVRFIEVNDSKYHNELYTPNPEIEAFATTDHPIYVEDELVSADLKLTQSCYPWLRVTREFNSIDVTFDENKYDYVYNLWVDGDGTYIVNGCGTTSIIFDGGMLSDFVEMGYFDVSKVRHLYEEYTKNGNTLLHGAFILNYALGKLKSRILYRLVAYAASKDFKSLTRKLIVTLPMLACAKLAHLTEKLHKWRFFK
jgi:hypothetical protein